MKRSYWIGLLVLILAVTAISGCKPKAKDAGEIPAIEKIVPQTVEYLTITARCGWDQSTSDLVCMLQDGHQTYIGDLITNQAMHGWELNTIAHGEADVFIFQRPYSK